jgi:hypothetical protein
MLLSCEHSSVMRLHRKSHRLPSREMVVMSIDERYDARVQYGYSPWDN